MIKITKHLIQSKVIAKGILSSGLPFFWSSSAAVFKSKEEHFKYIVSIKFFTIEKLLC